MNTWLTDIIRTTNERPFSGSELTRMAEYYDTVPARLKLSQELEKLEPGLVKPLHAELAKRHKTRAGLYTRRFAQDLVESLRVVNQAVLADDPRLVHNRWTGHVTLALAAAGTDPADVRDAYLVLREALEKQLTRPAWDVFRPVFDDMLDALVVPV